MCEIHACDADVGLRGAGAHARTCDRPRVTDLDVQEELYGLFAVLDLQCTCADARREGVTHLITHS